MVFVKKIVRQGAQIFHNISDFDKAVAAEPVEANASGSRDLEDYLNSWGLGMYIDKFKEQCVDLDTLRILTAEDLKELVPAIGHRAKLTSQIAMLKDIVTDAFSDNKTAEVLTNTTNKIYLLKDSNTVLVLDDERGESEEQETSSSYQTDANKDCELYKLLSSCNEGRSLLLQYQENGLLDSSARRRLCQEMNIVSNGKTYVTQRFSL